MRMTIVLSMLAAGVVPLAIASVIVTGQAREAMERSTRNALAANVELRTHGVETYVGLIRDNTASMAGNAAVQEAVGEFARAFSSVAEQAEARAGLDAGARDRSLRRYYEGEFVPRLSEGGGTGGERYFPSGDETARWLQFFYMSDNRNPVGEKHRLDASDGGLDYDRVHARHHAYFRAVLERYGYYDVFLVDSRSGHVIYSVFKEIDYATSLFEGPHRDSGLAEAARRATRLSEGEVTMTDFARYVPSYDAPAAFVASPVFLDGELEGALVVQMPVDRFSEIMSLDTGLGETGEAVILGSDGVMRSQSRLSDQPTSLVRSIDTEALARIGTEPSGELVEKHDGVSHVTAYARIDLPGLDWIMLAKRQSREAHADVAALFRTSAFIACLALLGAGLFSWLLGRRIHRTLGGDPVEIRAMAERVKRGDLATREGDESRVGAYRALVEMRARLREVLEEAAGVAGAVRSGVSEIAEGNRGLAERTEQQAANLEETASSTEELTSTVKNNSKNLHSANELALGTRRRAVASGEVANRAVGAMTEISSASERIADIIGVIDEIAFQTNLLALNAAVEAARAGEQGRGFAVVASEVRQLAGRSAEAAREIKDLIEDSVAKVRDGTALVRDSGEELEHIVEAVAKLTDIVGEISVASDEQASGIEQINQSLVHMDGTTQRNATMVEEAMRTSEAMTEQASRLAEHIGYFSVGDGLAVNDDKGRRRSSQSGGGSAATPSADRTAPATIVESPPRSRSSESTPRASTAEHTSALAAARAAAPSTAPAAPSRSVGNGEFWEEF